MKNTVFDLNFDFFFALIFCAAAGLASTNTFASTARCSASEIELKAAGDQAEKYWTFKCGLNTSELIISANNEHLAEMLIAAKAHNWTIEYSTGVVNFEKTVQHVTLPGQ